FSAASWPPLVPDVRHALLVPGAVAELDRLKAVPFVEAARTVVLLERPESEPAGETRLCVVEHLRADAVARRADVEVEVQQLVARQEHVAAYLTVVPDPAFMVGDASAEPADVLRVRVEHGEVGHRREDPLIEERDRLDILLRRASEHRRTLGRCRA